MAPQFVRPYVKTNKNAAADAERDLRSSQLAEHALRAHQQHGTAVSVGVALGSPRLRKGSHGAGQSNSRPPRGVQASLRAARRPPVAAQPAQQDGGGAVVPSFDYAMYARTISALLTLPRLHTYQEAVESRFCLRHFRSPCLN